MTEKLMEAFCEVEEALRAVEEVGDEYYYYKDRKLEHGDFHDLKEDYHICQGKFEYLYKEFAKLFKELFH